MRGKAFPHKACVPAARITPAYAGKSLTAVLLIHGGRDHPRLCGEKHGQKQKHRQTKGSPPPMRGKAFLLFVHTHFIRITPAYAGKRRVAGKKYDAI